MRYEMGRYYNIVQEGVGNLRLPPISLYYKYLYTFYLIISIVLDFTTCNK